MLGLCPIATKIPSTSNKEEVLSFNDLIEILFTNLGFSLPLISTTTEFHKKEIFVFAKALFWRIFSALSWSLLWINITSFANLVKNNASSTAVLPPPITATFLFLKKNASQVAQAETPCPLNFSSFFKPNHFALAPVAIIID